MPNGSDMLDDMAFDKELEAMGDDLPRLVKFMAWRQYNMMKELQKVTELCPVHSRQITILQSRSKKELGAIGGVAAFIGAVAVWIIDFLLRR